MQTGNVAAGILSPPYQLRADEAGFINLGSTAKQTPYFTQTVFNVRTEWAQEKKALLVRFLRAIVRASQFIHAQKEDTVRDHREAVQVQRKVFRRELALLRRHQRHSQGRRGQRQGRSTRFCNCSSKTAR